MAIVSMSNGIEQGSPLYDIMMCQNIIPGEQPSYAVCKEIYVAHPLAKKIIDSPKIGRAHV